MQRPITQTEVLVIVALAHDRLHGYAIWQRIKDETGDEILTGTLYRTLKRMEQNGLVAVVEPPDNDADKRRKYYRIAETGRQQALAELERMHTIVRWAQDTFIP